MAASTNCFRVTIRISRREKCGARRIALRFRSFAQSPAARPQQRPDHLIVDDMLARGVTNDQSDFAHRIDSRGGENSANETGIGLRYQSTRTGQCKPSLVLWDGLQNRRMQVSRHNSHAKAPRRKGTDWFIPCGFAPWRDIRCFRSVARPHAFGYNLGIVTTASSSWHLETCRNTRRRRF